MTASDSMSTEPTLKPRQIPGWIVVLGMLLAGAAATTVMFVYWDLHTKPFRTLTEAIGRTFEHSLPKVEGGRHKRGPMTLRIALRVPFSPEADQTSAANALDTICRLIREHQDLAGFERVHIHFFQMVPEAKAKSKLFELTPEEVQNRGVLP